uniref:Uncharacterized protein n=1 Tax=Anguilla anguilla TaxID=7936 RepID=A0A0E9XC93_ANGAN
MLITFTYLVRFHMPLKQFYNEELLPYNTICSTHEFSGTSVRFSFYLILKNYSQM